MEAGGGGRYRVARAGRDPARSPQAAVSAAAKPGGNHMAWKTPTISEVQVGMEINMYACAKRK
jgi:coenzyme PQQ precursor peptide PqqA